MSKSLKTFLKDGIRMFQTSDEKLHFVDIFLNIRPNRTIPLRKLWTTSERKNIFSC